MKKLLLALAVLVLLVIVGFFALAPGYVDRQMNTVATPPPYAASAEAQQLHDRLFVADLHADQLLWARDPLARADYGHVDVPRLLEGNVALQVFSAVTKSPSGQNYDENTGDTDRITYLVMAQRWPIATWSSLKERALYQAHRLHNAAAHSDGHLMVITSRADLDRFLARRAGQRDVVAGLLAIEGLHAMEADISNLDDLYAAGYRMMALTHFFDNALSGSAHGTERGGLTDLGREVIRRQEAMGIIVDLAHVAPKAIDDILDMATKPLVVSHTGVQATCPGPRNLTDAQIQRIADNGGIIGIGYWPGAVCDTSPEAIVRAMRHVADLVGPQHLALGSDFDGSVHTGFDTTGLAQITEALLADGFSEDDIALIMGTNFVRILLQTLPER